MLLTKKSDASKAVKPNILKSSSVLDDNAAGIPARKTRSPEIHATFLRERFLLAVKADVIISSILNEDVKIANKNNSRNKLRNKSPNGICANASGKTINKSPGPSVGSSPTAKTIGKIASPASSDTKIFIMDTEPAETGKLTLLSRYEL